MNTLCGNFKITDKKVIAADISFIRQFYPCPHTLYQRFSRFMRPGIIPVEAKKMISFTGINKRCNDMRSGRIGGMLTRPRGTLCWGRLGGWRCCLVPMATTLLPRWY